MKISYYHFADCPRFRIPVLDISSFDQEVKSILVESFDRGNSAAYALEQAIKDPSLMSSLVSQVAENLDFQRKNALENVKAETEKEVSLYQQEQETRIKSVEDYLKPTLEQKKVEYTEKKEEADEKLEFYNAAQRSLEEMRAKVQKSLAEVGGIEGYQGIERINSVLQYQLRATAPADSNNSTGKTHTTNLEYQKQEDKKAPKKKKKKELQKAMAIVTAEKNIDPLRNQNTLDQLVNESNSSTEEDLETLLKPSEENSWRRFWKKVWGIFNYNNW